MKLVGKYFRKSGAYNAMNGGDRKWTYKVGYHVSGKKMHLVALTDGMITKQKSHVDIMDWIEKEDMIQMSKIEVIAFFTHDESNFTA